MKKLILVFAICMAFAVKSFAYTGSARYELYEAGYLSESITMNCEEAGGNMGGSHPGYIEVIFYDFNGAQYAYWRWDYPNSYSHYGSGIAEGSGFYWIHPISYCQVIMQMWEYIDGGNSPNGVYLAWGD